MSDTKTPEGESAATAPSAPSTAPEEKPRPEHVERAPSRAEADYTPHFQEMVKHLMDMPEKLVNALREAIPDSPDEETQEEAVHGNQPEKEDETPVPPGGKQHISAKRGFAQRWLGQN